MFAGAKLSNPVAGITALGDSQTHGTGWVNELGVLLGETIYNEGQSSGKVGWALELDTEDPDVTPNTTFAPIEKWSRRKSRLYIVWFGHNDSNASYLGVGTSEAVREQTFRERLTRVCRICLDRGGQVALLATQQYPATLTDYVSRNDKTDRYDAIKADVAASMPGVYFIDETGFLFEDDEFVSAADLHSTAAGETRIAQAVYDGLEARELLL